MTRTAVITGAGRGIGAAIARALAAEGWEVLATDRDAPAAAFAGVAGVRTAALDVADAAASTQVLGALPSLDLLVNAAGVIRRGEEFDLEVFGQVVDVNLTGAMRTASAALPALAAAGGSIINIASMLTFFGGGRVPAYAASKGGVGQLTKSLAIAWAPRGVRVNAIAPGWISTDLTRELEDDRGRSEAILARTPLGRWGRPEDLTGAVAFLASPAAAYVTGVILPVDGGYAIT